MLYCNDKKYDLKKSEIDEIIQKFGNTFPIRVVYPKERVKRSLSSHNALPDMPAGISFPYRAVRKTEKGAEIWRYADEVIQLDGGKKKYIPSHFRYNGVHILDRNEMELIFFLLKICPHTKGGDNWNKKQPKLEFENLIEEANTEVEGKRADAELMALIYSDTVGMDEKKLREVARALFINNVDKLTKNQVRVGIEKSVKLDRQNGMKRFFKMFNSEAILTVRANIQRAVDERYIKYVVNRREWVWCDSDGKKKELIFQLKPGLNPEDAIYDYYIGEADFRERLNSAMKFTQATEPAVQ